MKYFLDITICCLLVALIHSVYTVGDLFIELHKETNESVSQTAYYKCGKNKKTDVYCPIVVKGG